jgi:hypothetical protein
MNEFDQKWASPEGRMAMVPGKEIFSALNSHLQQAHRIALSPIVVVGCFLRDEVCPQLLALLLKLDELRTAEVPEQPSLEFAPVT